MKPVTKLQQAVAQLYTKLPPLTHDQREYARTHRPYRKTFYNSGEIWCPDCGCITLRTIPKGHVADLKEKYTCPHCGAKSTLIYSRKTKLNQKAYFSIITMFEGWQVVRHFLCDWYFAKDERHPSFYIDEVVQSWITPDGCHEVFVARPRMAISGYADSFQTDKPLAVQNNHGAYYIWAEIIYPRASVSPLARRNGFSIPAACNALAPTELIRSLLQTERYPGLEMLVKIKQYSLVRAFFAGGNAFESYAAEIRICHRNHYIVHDGRMWCDYIRMCRRLNIDTRNPKFACPKNLKAAHDAVVERINRNRKKEEAERKRKEAIEWEAKYREAKGKFFGICFGNDNLVITVIQSVADIAEEGEAMHHCVFAAGYYKKNDSLILTARDKAGKRIETIELSLKTFQVLQSRGVCNKNTKYHDEIIALVNQNIHLFKQIKNKVA